jgi:2-polyprenyl-3-methyl-5-hydroxy-6-metoxy-1,4-benzoquinol methylase
MKKSYYKDYFVLEKQHWIFRVRRKIFLYFIEKHARPNARIFDFGCGSGYLVGGLQRMGYDAHGLDFEKEAIDYGVNSGVKNLTVGLGDKLEYPDASFDLVISLDVLEHLEDEKPVIAELTRVLKPGGKMMITTSAYKWLWSVHDEISHHFRRYTARSLTNIFEDFSELKMIRKTYYNTLLFPAIAAVRVSSRWFNIKNRKSDFDINNRFLDKLFYFIFNIESYLLKFMNLPFGVSILVILKKVKH